MDLRSLAATWLGAVLDLRAGRRTAPAYVRPPTVKEALTVLAALEAEKDGEDVADMLRVELRAWLPQSALSFLLKAPPLERAALLTWWLRLGVEDEKRQADEADAKARAASVGWGVVLAEYRAVYGADPLTEPWPYFLMMRRHIPTMRARAQYDAGAGFAAMHSEKGVKGLVRRAGYETPGPRRAYAPGEIDALRERAKAELARWQAARQQNAEA